MLRLCLSSLLAAALAACAQTQAPLLDHHQKVARSTGASVQLFLESDGSRRAGSGVIVALPAAGPAAAGADGTAVVLTAAHLLHEPLEGRLYAIDPASGEKRPAEILALDAEMDAAVLSVADLAADTVPIQDEARLGDPVWVVSFPWGKRATFATGVVSQIAGEGPGIPTVGPVSLIDAAVSYGTSGGGVFDAASGRLIGIVRGYRTAKLALPGSESGSLNLPIAGETTVVSASRLVCLMTRAGLNDALDGAVGQARDCAGETAAEATEKERRVETSLEVPTRQ